jgi:hypothetical protein
MWFKCRSTKRYLVCVLACEYPFTIEDINIGRIFPTPSARSAASKHYCHNLDTKDICIRLQLAVSDVERRQISGASTNQGHESSPRLCAADPGYGTVESHNVHPHSTLVPSYPALSFPFANYRCSDVSITLLALGATGRDQWY